MVQKTGWEQKKSLGNLIYFCCIYNHPITIALKSIYLLSQPLSRSRFIFLSVTYLLEISIKMPQRYLSLSPPTQLPSVLNYWHHLEIIPHFSLSPSQSYDERVFVSLAQIQFPFLWFHSIQTQTLCFWIVTIVALPLVSSFPKIHFPPCHWLIYFSANSHHIFFCLKASNGSPLPIR